MPDDTYIFLTYAKHFVQSGEIAFNLREPINGISSPLWFLISTIVFQISNLVSQSTEMPVLLIRISSGLFCGVACAAFGYLAFKKLSGLWSIFAFVLFIANPWLWRWAFSGMETSLALAAVCVVLLVYEVGTPFGRLHGVIACLLFGILIRPEFVLLGTVLLLHSVSWKSWKNFRIVHTLWAFPLVFWLWFAALKMESVMPQTGGAKAGVVSFETSLIYAIQVMLTSLPVCIVLIIFVGGLALVGHLWSDLFRAKELYYGSWIVILPISYALRGYIPISRYLLLTSPFLVLVTIRIVKWAHSKEMGLFRFKKPVVYASALLALAMSVFITATRVLPASSGAREVAYKEIGEWLCLNSPPEARIATTEIGALGYYSDRYIIDLMGLVLPNREYEILKTRNVSELLSFTRPSFTLRKLGMAVSKPVLAVESISHSASKPVFQEKIILYKNHWQEDE